MSKKWVLLILLLALTNSTYATTCGDTINSDLVLESDLTGCSGNGLNVGTGGINIDLNGKTISGTGTYGINYPNVGSGVKIFNGTIEGFTTSIYLSTYSATIENLTLNGSGSVAVRSIGGNGHIINNVTITEKNYFYYNGGNEGCTDTVTITNNNFSNGINGLVISCYNGGSYADNFIIRNNHFDGTSDYALNIERAMAANISNNTFYNSASGMKVGPSTTIENEDWSIYNITGVAFFIGRNYVNIRNVDLSGDGGTGIYIIGGSYSNITNVTINGRTNGILSYSNNACGDYNRIVECDLSNNENAIYTSCYGASNPRADYYVIANNSFDNSSSWGVIGNTLNYPTFYNNTCYGCANGFTIGSYTVFENKDLAKFSIPGTVIYLQGSYSRLANLNLSGTGSGTGISIYGGGSSNVTNVTSTNRYYGVVSVSNIPCASNMRFENNDFSSNAYGMRFTCYGGGSRMDNTLIANNDFSNSATQAINGNTVRYSTYHDNKYNGSAKGLYVGANGNVIANESFVSLSGWNLELVSDNNEVVNASFSHGSVGLYLHDSAENNNLTNNNMLNMTWAIYDEGSLYNYLIYNNTYGQIFTKNKDLDYTSNLTFPGTVNITSNNISVPHTYSSNVTLDVSGWSFTSPLILKDGASCSECENFTTLEGNVIFNISDSATYWITGGTENTAILSVIDTYSTTSINARNTFNITVNATCSGNVCTGVVLYVDPFGIHYFMLLLLSSAAVLGFFVKKAQTSTEYMVIMAIVIVIGLLVASTMGLIPSIGEIVEKRANDAEIRSMHIGINNYALTENDVYMEIQNNKVDIIIVDAISVDGQKVTSDIELKIGETSTFNSLITVSSTRKIPFEINYTYQGKSYTETGALMGINANSQYTSKSTLSNTPTTPAYLTGVANYSCGDLAIDESCTYTFTVNGTATGLYNFYGFATSTSASNAQASNQIITIG